ncbi:MAG: hypothetical protein ACYCXU_10460 [Thermoleophilia bacterium]
MAPAVVMVEVVEVPEVEVVAAVPVVVAGAGELTLGLVTCPPGSVELSVPSLRLAVSCPSQTGSG